MVTRYEFISRQNFEDIRKNMKSNGKRIDWIDIFKGLAIILVVVGHSTGLFNAYIYQFHVAAFFFISGWVAKFDGTSLFVSDE